MDSCGNHSLFPISAVFQVYILSFSFVTFSSCFSSPFFTSSIISIIFFIFIVSHHQNQFTNGTEVVVTRSTHSMLTPLSFFELKCFQVSLTEEGGNIIISFILCLSLFLNDHPPLFFFTLSFMSYSLYQLSPKQKFQSSCFLGQNNDLPPCLGTTLTYQTWTGCSDSSLPQNPVNHLHRLRSTGHTSACGFSNT